jgi:hypothetical protein
MPCGVTGLTTATEMYELDSRQMRSYSCLLWMALRPQQRVYCAEPIDIASSSTPPPWMRDTFNLEWNLELQCRDPPRLIANGH